MTSTRDFTASVGGGDQREELERLRAEVAEWRRRFAKGELRDIAFTNSATDVEPLYTAVDVDPQTAENLGVPFLTSKALDIHNRQSKHLDFAERGLYRFETRRLNDGDNQFHGRESS